MDIEKALEFAKIPGEVFCPECGEGYFSPIDKASIRLFDKCPIHLEDDSVQEKNLLKIAELL